MDILKINHKYYSVCVLSIIFSFSFFSCSKKWLDKKPDLTTVVPTSLDDCEGLMDNASNNTIYPSLGEIASDCHTISDQTYLSYIVVSERDAYIWDKTDRHINVASWNRAYSKIALANVVLEILDKWVAAGNTPNEKYNNIRGQALFLRSLNFYCLSQLYALQYQKGTATNLPGIVLRLDTDLEKPSARSNLQETFDVITKDLKEACSLLFPTASFPVKSSKWAAWALLARVYLVMGDYEKAWQAADECLKIRSTLIDFNTVPSSSDYIGYKNIENIFFYSTASSLVTSSAIFDSNLYNSYRNGDLRKRVYFRQIRGRLGFVGNYDNTRFTAFMGLATDEIFLIRAECYARQNKTNEAMADLNTLLRSRLDSTMTYEPLTAENAEEALITILEERKKELIVRGTRWSDIRRLNLDPRFSITLTRTIDGKTYTLEPNSPRYAFPIPDDVLDKTNLTQNPGYGK